MSFNDLKNKYNEIQERYNLLARQKTAQNQITDLLNKSAEALACGPECQKQKISSELKQKYLDAQTLVKTAPISLETAKKSYYVYTEGRPFYDSMLEEELKQKAEQIAKLLTESFNSQLTAVNILNKYYNTALINSGYTMDYLNDYIEENTKLKDTLKTRKGDILTNDRKTFYETDALNTLKLWYKLWWYIYYILVLVFVIAIFLSPSQLSILKKIIIGVLLIFYPYYINYIVQFTKDLVMKIYNNLPHNVYNNL